MSQQPSGVICTPADLARTKSGTTTIHCLSRGDSLGLMLTTEAAFVSLFALSYVFLVILWNIGRLYLDPEKDKKGLRLFRQPMDLLMLSLFFADTLQALGGALNIRWVNSGKVEVGSFCNAQGIMQNVGETAVALFNLAISVYTLASLWLRKDISSMRVTLGVIACIWIFIAIIVTVGNTTNHNPSYMSPTPYWCWIGHEYLVWRIVAEYMWFWIALLFSLVVYVPLLWVQRSARARWRQAFVFLAYPLAYCLSTLPMSITRWIGFIQESKYHRNFIPTAASFFSVVMFTLSGFFNVVLILNTKPNSGLFGHLVFVPPRRPPLPTLSDSESSTDPQASTRTTEESKAGPVSGLGRLP